MSGGGRTPAEILAVFGRDLRRVRPPKRRRWPRLPLLVAAVLAAGTASAVATNQLWAPSARVSAPARPAGAPVPDAASRPVYVASGPDWRLSASACRFGRHETVAVFLTVKYGGAGWRCGALSSAVAAGAVPPPTLFTPPRGSGHALLFGAAPARTTRVQALVIDSGSSRTELREIPARAIETPRPAAVYVARIAGDARLLTVVGLDAGGHPRFCVEDAKLRAERFIVRATRLPGGDIVLEGFADPDQISWITVERSIGPGAFRLPLARRSGAFFVAINGRHPDGGAFKLHAARRGAPVRYTGMRKVRLRPSGE